MDIILLRLDAANSTNAVLTNMSTKYPFFDDENLTQWSTNVTKELEDEANRVRRYRYIGIEHPLLVLILSESILISISILKK